LRHGAGHNVAFYVYDDTGTIVEYSAEEEIILNPGRNPGRFTTRVMRTPSLAGDGGRGRSFRALGRLFDVHSLFMDFAHGSTPFSPI
jgi:hypothetical protein